MFTRGVSTLDRVMSARRRRHFVGRAAEVALFREAMKSSAPGVLFYVHGPGGIGKTALLDVFADEAGDAGRHVCRFDGRDLMASPRALAETLDRLLDQASPGPVALLLDSYERLAPLEPWLRGQMLPRLPAETVIAIGGRTEPSAAWLADPAWRDALCVMPLRNLRPEDSRQYLTACGVDPAEHDKLVAVSHGHPLGLSLLADLVRRTKIDEVGLMTPDLVRRLLVSILDNVPSPTHRRAIEIAALARVTTEGLLRDALDVDDAYELFHWLRGLSFMEYGPDGLFPHDLAREALDADLRWRDPDAYRMAFRGVRSHVAGRLRRVKGREQQSAVFDEKFLLRHQPDLMAHLDWDSLGQHYPEPAGPRDRDALLTLVEKWEGGDSAAIAERWFHQQPQGFFVVRHQDGTLRGFAALVDLTIASPQDISADPGARAAWDHARRHAPARPAEKVTQTRFLIDAQAHQRPSPTVNIGPMVSIQHWLNTPNLAWDFVTLLEPDSWDDYFNFAGLARAEGADFEVAGRRYGLFAMDLRRQTVESWLELVTERALARDFTPARPTAPEEPIFVLSEPEFEQAVRQALRDLSRRDRLAANPLARSRLVLSHAGNRDTASALGDLVREAIDRLRASPRDEKLFHVLDRTYLRPAATQEGAAEVLDLPLSTYKRHLRRAVEQIVADLWQRELTTVK